VVVKVQSKGLICMLRVTSELHRHGPWLEACGSCVAPRNEASRNEASRMDVGAGVRERLAERGGTVRASSLSRRRP